MRSGLWIRISVGVSKFTIQVHHTVLEQCVCYYKIHAIANLYNIIYNEIPIRVLMCIPSEKALHLNPSINQNIFMQIPIWLSNKKYTKYKTVGNSFCKTIKSIFLKYFFFFCAETCIDKVIPLVINTISIIRV